MPTVSTMTEKGIIAKHLNNSSKKAWKGCRNLLVPLMIAVFTITTTVLQMNATKLINEQNLQIAIDNRDIANYSRLQQLEIEDRRRNLELKIEEDRREVDKQVAQHNREQDLNIANETRLHQIAIEEVRLEQERQIEDKRRAADFLATESRQMDSILSIYLKEMSEFLLNDNFTLGNPRWAIVVRAKTLTILRQLDGKRKSHAIQFLFEAGLLTQNKHPIDLTNADLNNIDMSGKKLNNISLSGAFLYNSKFIGSTLDNSNFSSTKFINSTFEKAKLVNVSFYDCDGSQSDFDGADLIGTNFMFARLTKTTWRNMNGQKIIFDKARVDDADFSDANLPWTRFYHTNLRGSMFEKAKLQFVNWQGADVLGADLFQANCQQSNINKKQLQEAFSFKEAILPNGTKAGKMNLLIVPGAENGKGNCSTHGWNPDKTMEARRYNLNKVATSLGVCFFTGIEGGIRATMRQRVKINSTKNLEKRHLWFYGRCREFIPEDEFLVQFQIVQFNKENNILAIDNLTSSTQSEHCKKSFDCNSTTTTVELEVIFRRQLSAPTNNPFGYCDNLHLAVYEDN